MKIVITLIALFLFNIGFSQINEQYSPLIKEAEALYNNEKFVLSAQKYKEAFATIEGKAIPNDRYNCACSYALAGFIDTAFYHLYRLANDSKYKKYSHITTDGDLRNLYQDERWKELINLVRANKEFAERNLDRELVTLLSIIYEEDQKYRVALDTIEEKYGWDSDEVQSHWQIIHEKDSMNLIEVSKILDEQGWLGPDVVGQQGNSTLFLVVQHADIKTQEKYLPMMREAVNIGNAQASSLALLEDRVALRQGRKQIYGSQVWKLQGKWCVRPLEDPENVDKRRAEVGLGTLKEYTEYFGFTWNIEEYYKSLPEQMEKLK